MNSNCRLITAFCRGVPRALSSPPVGTAWGLAHLVCLLRLAPCGQFQSYVIFMSPSSLSLQERSGAVNLKSDTVIYIYYMLYIIYYIYYIHSYIYMHTHAHIDTQLTHNIHNSYTSIRPVHTLSGSEKIRSLNV